MPLLSERYLLGDHMYEQDLPVEVRLSRDRLEILLPSTSVRTRGRNGDHPHLEKTEYVQPLGRLLDLCLRVVDEPS